MGHRRNGSSVNRASPHHSNAAMRRLTPLSTLLPLLSAPRVAHAQDVSVWKVRGSKPSDYAMSAEGSPMSATGATLSLRSTASPARP